MYGQGVVLYSQWGCPVVVRPSVAEPASSTSSNGSPATWPMDQAASLPAAAPPPSLRRCVCHPNVVPRAGSSAPPFFRFPPPLRSWIALPHWAAFGRRLDSVDRGCEAAPQVGIGDETHANDTPLSCRPGYEIILGGPRSSLGLVPDLTSLLEAVRLLHTPSFGPGSTVGAFVIRVDAALQATYLQDPW